VGWTLEYYEQHDGTQPGEVFEDWLDRKHAKLGGKLLRLATEVEAQGPNLGGGYFEPCHDYEGLWEIRARFQKSLGREFLGFDDDRAVLLHGYVKGVDEPAHVEEFKQAHKFWRDYLTKRRVSPEQEVPNESL
jgi:hypothetical protein